MNRWWSVQITCQSVEFCPNHVVIHCRIPSAFVFFFFISILVASQYAGIKTFKDRPRIFCRIQNISMKCNKVENMFDLISYMKDLKHLRILDLSFNPISLREKIMNVCCLLLPNITLLNGQAADESLKVFFTTLYDHIIKYICLAKHHLAKFPRGVKMNACYAFIFAIIHLLDWPYQTWVMDSSHFTQTEMSTQTWFSWSQKADHESSWRVVSELVISVFSAVLWIAFGPNLGFFYQKFS